MILIDRIRLEVELKNLTEFRAGQLEALINSPSFLSKHAKGNGRYTEYFERVSRGLYKLI